MPLFLSPRARVDVVLPCDADSPAESRPTYIARVASMEGRQEVAQLCAEATAVRTVGEQRAKLIEALNLIFVGWRNVGDVPFSPDNWPKVLTDNQEAYDLLQAWLERTNLTEEDRRGFTSPAASGPASSAPDASAAV